MKRIAHIVFVLSLVLACGASAVASLPAKASLSDVETKPVWINAFYTDRPVEPDWFTPTPSYWCSNYSTDLRYVDQIQWSSWGTSTATGTAIAGRNCIKTITSPEPTFEPVQPIDGSPVTVTLGGRKPCGGSLVYTTYSLELAPGAAQPAFWSKLHHGGMPCNAAAPRCTADLVPGEFEAGGPVDCGLGLESLVGHKKVAARWQPKTPPGQVPQLRRVLAAKWKNWGLNTAIGRGAMLDQHKIGHGREIDLLWPAKVELGDPVWCPHLGEQQLQGNYGNPISYTTLRLTLYGEGLEENKSTSSSKLMIRARNMVGRPELRKQIFTQRSRIDRAYCAY